MKAVAYARYSSDNQRQESIDAQVRAIKYYATQYGYEIVNIYTDKAKTGRTTDRPSFQQMIKDSASGLFNAVIVHKLDRFSRDSADTLYYERLLNQNGVELVSVNEKLDNTPEGALMKMIIAGMNEFYSKNLAREVMKGLKENAYNCKHTGGMLPLGYDVDKNKNYILNRKESEAVKLIYGMYIVGYGYSDIINELNSNGYKTKLGRQFGKNSLYEILKNEKYTGTFIYNKSASRNIKGTFNRHSYKNEKDIIKIENGIPKIIEKEIFQEVQKKMELNKRKTAQYKAKVTYLLSGLLECGECKGAMTGETRRYRDKEYSYYVCARQKRDKTCNMKPIRKELLESAVINNINKKIFDPDSVHNICERIYESYQNSDVDEKTKELDKEVYSIDFKIGNLCKAIENGLDYEEATKRINTLKEEKNDLQYKIIELNSVPNAEKKTVDQMVNEFMAIDVANLSLENQKKIIQSFVSKVFVYGNEKEDIKIRVVINPNKMNIDEFLDTNGGEGGI